MNWTTAKLGEVTNILSGTTPVSGNPAYWNGDLVWVTPTDLGSLQGMVITTSARRITEDGRVSCSLSQVPAGSVVMSSRAPIGHMAMAGCDLYTNQGCKSLVCGPEIDPYFLYFSLKFRMGEIRALGSGATFDEVSKSKLEAFEISFPPIQTQRQIAERLIYQLAYIENARVAAAVQLREVAALANAIISDSIRSSAVSRLLGEVLDEVKNGIGAEWASYAVLGATRGGLAPAKEPPGKQAHKYKPAVSGTVFYNPMRILIGSIAYVDDDDSPGITSPDYVVLRGKLNTVDSRWFYYWLRSPLGVKCILSLARGAVRERMLFSRLAEGEIVLPSFAEQKRASVALRELKPLKRSIESRLCEINLLPQKILSLTFEK